MNIRQRLILLISLLVILASLTVGGMAILTSMRIIEENTREWMVNEVGIGALLVSSSIQNRFDIIRELANRDAVRSMEWDRQYEMLISYTRDMGFDDFAIVDMEGNARHLKGDIPNLRSQEYIQRALRGEQTLSGVISQADSAVRVSFPIINYVVPIQTDGRVTGALLARTNAGDLNRITANIKARGNSYAFMINTQGHIISHTTRPELILRSPVEMARTDTAMGSLGQATQYMLSRRQGGETYYRFNTTTMLCAFTPVGNFDMILVLTAERDSLMVEVVRLRSMIIIVVAAFMAVGFVVALRIAGWISRRLKNVRNTVVRLGDGDFSKKHPILAKDEIGDIAGALNQCMDNIQHLVKTIKEKTSAISTIGRELSDNMVQTTDSMNRIDANVENINKRMKNQSASVSETNSTMRQIIGTISKLSENVEAQSESVTKSS